jgi:hypothetical protein
VEVGAGGGAACVTVVPPLEYETGALYVGFDGEITMIFLITWRMTTLRGGATAFLFVASAAGLGTDPRTATPVKKVAAPATQASARTCALGHRIRFGRAPSVIESAPGRATAGGVFGVGTGVGSLE